MRNNEAIQESQKLGLQNLVVLFSIKLLSGERLLLTPNSNENSVEILTMGSLEFISLPIEMEEITLTGSGSSDRPRLSIGNIEGAFSRVNFSNPSIYDEVLGSKVTRYVTYKKFIDSFNTDFPNGDLVDLENNLSVARKDRFILDRVASKNILAVTFELAAPYDLHAIKLPSKLIAGGYCPFVYKGAKNYRDKAARTIGGCTWNNVIIDNQTDLNGELSNAILPVYMTAADEYIVNFDSVTFENGDFPSTLDEIAGIKVEKNHYYQTTGNTATQVLNTGELLPDQPVKDYWQALEDIDEAFSDNHSPSDTSKFWRRVRVFRAYDPTITFKAYRDKTRNEYTSFRKINSKAQKTVTIPTNDRLSLTSVLGNTVTVVVSDITDLIFLGEIDSLAIFNSTGLAMIRVPADVNDPLLGLKTTKDYVITTEEDGRIKFFTLCLDDYFSAAVFTDELFSDATTNIYQVNPITQEAGQHVQLPGVNTSWREGDICGKSLTSCALRFQAQAIIDDNTALDIIDIGEGVPFSIMGNPFPTSDGIVARNLGAGLEDDSIGYVVPFVTTISVSLLESAFYEQNENPETLIDPTEEAPTSINIHQTKGTFNLQAFNDGGTILTDITLHPISLFFGIRVGGGDIQYPIPKGINLSTHSDIIELVSIPFAYKIHEPGRFDTRLALYYLPDAVVGIDEVQTSADLPNPFQAVQSGKLVGVTDGSDFSSMNFNGGLKIGLNNPFPLYNDNFLETTKTISSFSETVPANVFFNFNVVENITERNSYIATEKKTSVVLPFGAFPGTKRF